MTKMERAPINSRPWRLVVFSLVVVLCLTPAGAADEDDEEEALICEKGGRGMLFPLFPGESNWPKGLRSILYLLGLLWTFLGVGIIADIFMGSIEVITSKETITQTKTGAVVPVKIWNATVANLTLMALGSSAPEILLNVIEIISNNYFAGDLGPSTIVGSAAFNLLIIIAVCVAAVVPVGERKIEGTDVYMCTAFFSVFAYVWLVVILKVTSPDVVTVPEALITFAFFPLLVALAFSLDNGYISFPGMPKASKSHITQIGTSHFHPYEIEKYLQELEATHGSLTPEKREEMMIAALSSKVKPSRAQYRMMATKNLSGQKKLAVPKPSANGASGVGSDKATGLEMSAIKSDGEVNPTVVNFKASAYSVLENAGKIVVTVVRSSGAGSLQVDYATEGVTANAGEDFTETEGVLTFGPGETEKTVEVEIIDDDEPEEDEMFLVKLSNPRPAPAKIGSEGMTIVTIIDDDEPGLLGFKDEETHATVQESDGHAHIFVSRFKGSTGTVSVDYTTVNISALGGSQEALDNPDSKTPPFDFVATTGTLSFKPEEMRHEIMVPVVDRKSYDKADTFKVLLSNVKGPNEKAQLAEYHQCVVTIVQNGDTKNVIDKVAQVLNINADKYSVGTSSWKEQFKNACTIGDDVGLDGLEDGEEPPPPTCVDYLLHFLSLPWKLLFATTPPTEYGGGWVCFCVALVYIGGVTAMIADLANLFGCTVGLENEITAITLVALGTSLPDTFASKAAAVNDDNADASVGNVTGSNSVNVFLGLGLPWSIAALYWQVNGVSDEWIERYGGSDDDGALFPDFDRTRDSFPGFVVPAGSLGFSVICFTLCALVALATLSVRRSVYGCELGGPVGPAYATAAFLIGLWFLYVTLSVLQIKNLINTGPL